MQNKMSYFEPPQWRQPIRFAAIFWRNFALVCLALFPGLSFGGTAVTNESLAYMRAKDVPHPYCEGNVNLDVADEYFVEIANDLPGVLLYNEMIGLYRKKEWGPLDEKWAMFRKKFKTSPLMEAASYLMADSQFGRLSRDQAPNET